MMMGKPMKVTSESFQERLNMKKITPVAFTTLRRKMLMFWETRSLTMVVSDVRREMTSPAATRGWGRREQGHVHHSRSLPSHVLCPMPGARRSSPFNPPLTGGLKGGMERG